MVGALLGRQHTQTAALTWPPRTGCAPLVAEDLANAAIAKQLVPIERTIETHIASVTTTLDLLQTPDADRRVLLERFGTVAYGNTCRIVANQPAAPE